MVIRKEQDGSIYIITTGGGGNPTTDLKDHVEGILWWSPCLFNLYAEYIMQNAMLDEAQA